MLSGTIPGWVLGNNRIVYVKFLEVFQFSIFHLFSLMLDMLQSI